MCRLIGVVLQLRNKYIMMINTEFVAEFEAAGVYNSLKMNIIFPVFKSTLIAVALSALK